MLCAVVDVDGLRDGGTPVTPSMVNTVRSRSVAATPASPPGMTARGACEIGAAVAG